eukprot:768812-Hanusia_phi.AAC.2
MLIGVNCCLFNPPSTIYHKAAIEFLRGAVSLLAGRGEETRRDEGERSRRRQGKRRDVRMTSSEESEDEQPRTRKRGRMSEGSEDEAATSTRSRRSSRKTNGGERMTLRLRNSSNVRYHDASASESE